MAQQNHQGTWAAASHAFQLDSKEARLGRSFCTHISISAESVLQAVLQEPKFNFLGKALGGHCNQQSLNLTETQRHCPYKKRRPASMDTVLCDGECNINTSYNAHLNLLRGSRAALYCNFHRALQGCPQRQRNT
eukprot:1158753-Pelagomonas_calceolata.AAC.4